MTADPHGPIMSGHVGEADEPWIDPDGLLRRGASWVYLPEIDWEIMKLLLARVGYLVRRTDVMEVGWPGRPVTQGSLNVRMKLVRQRVRPLGLVITTVRSRGFVLSVLADE